MFQKGVKKHGVLNLPIFDGSILPLFVPNSLKLPFFGVTLRASLANMLPLTHYEALASLFRNTHCLTLMWSGHNPSCKTYIVLRKFWNNSLVTATAQLSLSSMMMLYAFLSNRCMKIKVNESLLTSRSVPGGSLQGTLLGNFLFIISTDPEETVKYWTDHIALMKVTYQQKKRKIRTAL